MEIRTALVGTGTIGSGVVQVLKNNSKIIKKRTMVDIALKKVCELDFDKAKKLGIDEKILTKDYKEIIADKETDVIIELIGGYEPARTIILEALNAKKHVVTANKAVIAKHGKEIFEAASKNNVRICFEAAVGGCIPIIKSIRESYASERINTIYGILNGTTNYILSRMEEDMTYDESLKKAQELGFAEADPTFDVDGHDAAQKIVILSRFCFNSFIPEKIPVFGISKLKISDVEYAKKLGYKIKLLAISKLRNNSKLLQNKSRQGNNELDIRVQPVLVPFKHPLASVNEEINAVYTIGDQTKESMFYGRGAGMLPTATVVVSDIIDIAKKPEDRFDFSESVKLKDPDEVESRLYLRFMIVDKPGVLAKLAKVLGDNNISINAVMQNEEDKEIIPAILITHIAKQRDIRKAMKEIEKLGIVREKPVYLMIEE
jgi:homoserine dehydrogenase